MKIDLKYICWKYVEESKTEAKGILIYDMWEFNTHYILEKLLKGLEGTVGKTF